jgi:hypothetical protein
MLENRSFDGVQRQCGLVLNATQQQALSMYGFDQPLFQPEAYMMCGRRVSVQVIDARLVENDYWLIVVLHAAGTRTSPYLYFCSNRKYLFRLAHLLRKRAIPALLFCPQTFEADHNTIMSRYQCGRSPSQNLITFFVLYKPWLTGAAGQTRLSLSPKRRSLVWHQCL